MDRRKFITSTGAAAAGALLINPASGLAAETSDRQVKKRLALVGTGVRGIGMYGRNLLRDYSDYVEMVGLCDINPGRLRFADEAIGAGCPIFTDLEEMIRKQKPETLIVTTEDSAHHDVIIKGMQMGCDIITEKPLTIDEVKAQAIIDAERKYGKRIIVTFNYRYPPYRAKMKELIMEGLIGDVRSVDFHWNIHHAHLQQYMMRWHGESNRGGTLWVHKATHHFDMANWFINSEPEQVQAFGTLERFGSKGPFRGNKCRDCAHTGKCPYYWNINENDYLKRLYADNEHYDGYIRDNCVFRHQIDIHDKHSAIVKYANGVYLNYSLTGDTDYDGYWIAFNGTRGRLEARVLGFPRKDHVDLVFTPVSIYNDKAAEVIKVPFDSGGHWGGDPIMMDKLFKDPDMPDPLGQQAGVRDGVMSIIIGIAARKSIAGSKPVNIADLTDLKPMAVRPAFI
ncbi:MAG: Gfo/Idh/MocA family oxidoreductase [Bacteroidales bacterium]